MPYILENTEESKRLEDQSHHSAYDIENELKEIEAPSSGRFLDAGCGTGIAARYLANHFPGAQIEGTDFSALRLQEAKKLSHAAKRQIQYFEGSLDSIQRENRTYDLAVCRYVYQHLENPSRVSGELFRILKPGGQAVVIDFDGVIFNLSTKDHRLLGMLEKLREGLKTDLFVGRKIPGFLKDAGFGRIQCKIDVIYFQSKELEAEIELTKQRLAYALPTTVQILGSEANAHEFSSRYLEALSHPGSVLFYNKFTVTGLA